LVKRDDLNTPGTLIGGNKARALQFLLGEVPSGDRVVTVGGVGSTHVLATLVASKALGLDARACRWPHEANPTSLRVAAAIAASGRPAPVYPTAMQALVAAGWRRLRHGDWWIPFGGTSPLGLLGHIEGLFECVDQVAAGLLPVPARVVVPYGTGGTAAGIALGAELAGMPTRIVAVRCGPSFGHERWWLRRLLGKTARWLALGKDVADRALGRIEIDHSAWSGAYARPHPGAAARADLILRERGLVLDATYSAKACSVAVQGLDRADGPTLYWHTFDARWMTDAPTLAGSP
jgi:D-cysteine desulfhydrase